jgi:hypothetical protein
MPTPSPQPPKTNVKIKTKFQPPTAGLSVFAGNGVFGHWLLAFVLTLVFSGWFFWSFCPQFALQWLRGK